MEMNAAVVGVRRGERAQEREAHRRRVEGCQTWSFQDRGVVVGWDEVEEVPWVAGWVVCCRNGEGEVKQEKVVLAGT